MEGEVEYVPKMSERERRRKFTWNKCGRKLGLKQGWMVVRNHRTIYNYKESIPSFS